MAAYKRFHGNCIHVTLNFTLAFCFFNSAFRNTWTSLAAPGGIGGTALSPSLKVCDHFSRERDDSIVTVAVSGLLHPFICTVNTICPPYPLFSADVQVTLLQWLLTAHSVPSGKWTCGHFPWSWLFLRTACCFGGCPVILKWIEPMKKITKTWTQKLKWGTRFY